MSSKLRSIVLALFFTLMAPIAVVRAQGEVYYEVFVRSFQDSDGDGIGDLGGVVDRLDYLAELGVTGLWLMPVHPSPSYHGYDVTDYYAVNPDYGDKADFERLVSEAHRRGMKVILDLVVNHTSDRHPWFVASAAGDPAYREHYLWSKENPGWRGLSGPAWHASGGSYYLGLFWSGMPDLNFRNPAVRREMQQVARFWLELGVDGFRIDAIQHVIESPSGLIRNTPENLAWVREFEAFIKSVDPEAFVVGETWTDTGTIADYFRRAELDMAFDYPQYLALMAGISRRSLFDLEFTLASAGELYPQGARLATFISNHDQIRPVTKLGLLRADVARARLAAGLLLTLPGTPFLYYGDEIGMPNGPGTRDEEKRTPMRWNGGDAAGFTTGTPWYAFSTDDPEVTVAAQQGDPASMLSWYAALIELRQGHAALHGGEFEPLELQEDGLFGFIRSSGAQRVLVLANVGRRAVEIDLTVVAGDASASDLMLGEPISGSLLLAPLDLRVLALTEP